MVTQAKIVHGLLGSFKVPAKKITPTLAVVFLLINAFVWGVSWWPFRQLEALGLHSLWATTIIYSLAVGVILLWQGNALAHLFRKPGLLWLALGAGLTNAFFNWAVTIGDVVRVVLLFYLMPVWAVVLARLILNEPITPSALARIALALSGAALVLTPDGQSLPIPTGLAEWLGIAGGMSFALNNIMLRKYADEPESARAIAMFLGGALCAGLLAFALLEVGFIKAPVWEHWNQWVMGALALTVAFLIGNFALQLGAGNLPANVTAVVMLCEIIFASVSAILLGAGTLSTRTLIGGLLILSASLLALIFRTKEPQL
jgi:drug/metabolite transporter (DMT)-like permease